MNTHAIGEIQTCEPRNRAAAYLRFRPHGHQNQHKSRLRETVRNKEEFPVAFINRWQECLMHCRERRLPFAMTLAITPFSGLRFHLRTLFRHSIYENGGINVRILR